MTGHVYFAETRRRAEFTWHQLTRPPVIIEHRRIRGLPLPANRQGRVPPPPPPNEDLHFCSWCADSPERTDPHHRYLSCQAQARKS